MADKSIRFTKQLAGMCKDVTLRENEFKATALKRRFPGQTIINCDQTIILRFGKNVKWDFVSRNIHRPKFSSSSKYQAGPTFICTQQYPCQSRPTPSSPGKQTRPTPSSLREILSRNCGEIPNHCISGFRGNVSHNIDNQLTKAWPQ